MPKRERIELIADVLHEQKCPPSEECQCGCTEDHYRAKAVELIRTGEADKIVVDN